jgi:hypothetical protein
MRLLWRGDDGCRLGLEVSIHLPRFPDADFWFHSLLSSSRAGKNIGWLPQRQQVRGGHQRSDQFSPDETAGTHTSHLAPARPQPHLAPAREVVVVHIHTRTVSLRLLVAVCGGQSV